MNRRGQTTEAHRTPRLLETGTLRGAGLGPPICDEADTEDTLHDGPPSSGAFVVPSRIGRILFTGSVAITRRTEPRRAVGQGGAIPLPLCVRL